MKTSGLISLNDLHSYHVLERQVLKGQYKNLVLHLMPPPSAGGVLMMQVLKILEEFSKKERALTNISKIHLFVEALRRAYITRYKELGDPGFQKLSSQKLYRKITLKR